MVPDSLADITKDLKRQNVETHRKYLLINQVNQVTDNNTLTSLTNVNVCVKFKYVIVEVNN